MSALPKSERYIPWLETGDALTRDEFERRYHAMPASTRAELIEGIVYMSSPVRFTQHGNPHALVATWLTVYSGSTSGTRVGADSTVRLDPGNEPQPDGVLFLGPAAGGKATIDKQGYIAGPPELVVEVAASTVSIDLHAKLHAYRRNRVSEYVVWRTEDEAFDWFVLRRKAYVPLSPDADGVLKSQTFPGLWLDPPAFIRQDVPALLAALNRGLASPEHAAFVARLRDAAARPPAP